METILSVLHKQTKKHIVQGIHTVKVWQNIWYDKRFPISKDFFICTSIDGVGVNFESFLNTLYLSSLLLLNI